MVVNALMYYFILLPSMDYLFIFLYISHPPLVGNPLRNTKLVDKTLKDKRGVGKSCAIL